MIPAFYRMAKRIPLKARLGIIFVLTILLLPHLPGLSIREEISSSKSVYDRDNNLLRLTLSDDEKYRLWIPFKDIPVDLIRAAVLKEDRYFWCHPGVNPVAIVKAFFSTYISRNRMIGGSTITMQLVRIKYKMKTRTVWGKLHQILRAIQYEAFYTKKEIMEAYLDLAPYGGNVEGVGAASLIYFSKEAERLTLPEILALTVIPQNPSQIGQESVETARLRLLDKWIEEYPEDAPKKPLFAVPPEFLNAKELPFLAPHFVENILKRDMRNVNITTTLNMKYQKMIELQVKDYVERKKELGIHNAAAMLVDMRDMGVVASVGSADYFNSEISGQVNGTTAKRSPGSAVKPFMYALAVDQGLIHSMTMLKDSPFGIGGFNPENFDGEFHGPLSVHDALIQSRNVPAVEVAAQLNDPDLYGFMKSAGIDLQEKREYYGMSLVLGGAEVTMEDLVRMYAMYANEGIMKPLRYLKGEKQAEGVRLLSREACYLILDILKDNPRPDLRYKISWTKDPMNVYWKTGTSYSFKDAWAVGIFGHYILAVWIGNFNGVGNPSFVGIRAAAPLFFKIVDAVKTAEPDLYFPGWIDRLDIEKVKVCAASGQIPNQYCPKTVTTLFIPGKSPIKKCEIHRAIPIDIKTGLRVSDEGLPGARMEVYEFWPSDLLKIFRMAGIPRRTPPPFHPAYRKENTGSGGLPPKITSPQAGLIYHYRLKDSKSNGISLAAVSDADVQELCWFANKQYLGKVSRDKSLFWEPKPGIYVVRVVDDYGRSDSISITVHAIN